MPPHQHARTWLVVHLVLFFVMLATVMGLAIAHVGNLDQLFNVRTLVLFAAISIGLTLFEQMLFRLLLHARCPECAGRLRIRQQDPVTYVCGSCGFEQASGVSIRYGSRSR